MRNQMADYPKLAINGEDGHLEYYIGVHLVEYCLWGMIHKGKNVPKVFDEHNPRNLIPC